MIVSFSEFARRVGLRTRMLVLAPHPDDETLGCGGLMKLAGCAGIDVSVVLVTDGGASHPGSAAWPRDRLAARRLDELDAALDLLGVTRAPITLALPDAGTECLPAKSVQQATATTAEAIQRLRPDVVLTTWRREPHCDHRFAFELAQNALALVGSPAALVEYLVWTPVTGEPEDWPREDEGQTLLLDVGSVQDTKRAALRCHQSQLGGLITDDPGGFSLTPQHLEIMMGPYERYAQMR